TGGRIDVEITAFQIRDDSGAPLYLATVTRDITERKKAEADQARLKDELFQAQKMESIGRLAGGVAHDFNNMLTVILGYAGLIKSKSSLSSQCAGYLDEIERAANRSQEITRQLLGFSRRQIIAPKPVVLNSLLAELQDPLARLIGEDIEFRFHPQAALWTALLDPSQVNQILLNLVVNARDAMPHGGKLTIETANLAVSGEPHRARFGCKAGEYVTVSVSDNGSGMSEETMAHMFEPFFTTKGAGKGSGLGLATVYGIVRQNGGFVDVDSVLGQGTTVKIYFPRCAEESAAHEPGASGGVIAGSGAILLVEDDELLRGLTTDALSSLGYTPLVAASGEEALELCGRPETRLRLVITDVVMPGMSGVELRDRMRTLRPDLKVLFMSGYASDVIANRGVLMKGVHYIQKPFSIEELAAKIAETLRSA
ncbi:MAG TPA: ATP-binding protein, partial [Candidatus Sulfopaludibacter sp.]|nr:ATP-binding protein [Candidatus Sulfopaludibacter sp.]